MRIPTKLLVAGALMTGCFNVTAANAQNQPAPDTDTAQHHERVTHREMHSEHMDMHRHGRWHRHCTIRWHHHRRIRVCR